MNNKRNGNNWRRMRKICENCRFWHCNENMGSNASLGECEQDNYEVWAWDDFCDDYEEAAQ